MKIQKSLWRTLLTLTLTLLMAIAFSAVSLATSSPKKNILIINSYDPDNPWTQSEEQGIQESLSDLGETVSFFHEYMDTKHFHELAYEEAFSNYLQEKYRHQKIDIVVTTDDFATLFVKANKDLFIKADVPVVFCGVNDLTFKADRFAGVYENVDLKGTISLIQSIHGEKTPIVMVTDKSLSSISITKSLKDNSEWLKSQNVEFISVSDPMQIKKKLNNFKNGAVLFLLFNEDNEGNSYTYFEGLDMIRSYTDLPIYSVWDFYLGRGVVGGSMITKEAMGEDVGQMIRRLLAGEELTSLSSKTTQARNVMDYEMMTRYGLEKTVNLGKAEVVNRPSTFWTENGSVIMLFTGMIVIFIILVMLLVNSIRQKNKYYQLVGEHKSEILNSSQKQERKIEELQNKIREISERNEMLVLGTLEFRKRAGLSERLPFILHEINALLATMKSKLSYLESHSDHISRNETGLDVETQYKELTDVLRDSIGNCDIDLEHIIQLVGSTKTCFSDLGVDDHRNYKIKGFVDAFWTMLKPTVKKKKVSFISKIPEDLSLFGNPGDFVTIIAILMGNSLRHGMNGSSERELNIEFEAYASQAQLHFIYRDNGLGCDTEKLEKAMNRGVDEFVIGKDGIGLFQLNRIVTTILKGTISISGDYNQGVQVRINIPKAGESHEYPR